MAYPNPLIFKNAEIARDAITKQQKREIAKMYSDWSDEILEMRDTLVRSRNISSELTWYQLDDLRTQLRVQSNRIMREADGLIRRNIYIMSNEVLKSNIDLLKAAGITNVDKFAMAFSNVPSSIVEKLVTGQIYDTGWSLSKSIWSANEKVLQEAYGIVAKGVAANQSISEMTKTLSAYVDPKHRKPWNLVMKDGTRIYPRQVDYAAQRLARTLVQHSYQQSFVELTENNPFVKEYVWVSNGSRACELCIERDGVHFKKDMLPLDHPNGMCTMVPVISETMVEDLNKWLSSDDGDMPEIDEFAKNFGYDKGTPKKNIFVNANKDISTSATEKLQESLTQARKQELMSKLMNNIKDKFENISNDWVNALSYDKISSVKAYTGSDYRRINTLLRAQNFDEIDDRIKQHILNIDDALSKSIVEDTIIVRRGADSRSLSGIIGYDKETPFLLEGRKFRNYADDITERYVGTIVTDKGFLSTSPFSSGGFHDDVEYIIELPKGSKAAYVDLISSNRGEGELLIARDTKFILEGIEIHEEEAGKSPLRVFLKAIVD